MPSFICTSCGTQYAESQTPPDRCAICAADRRPPIERAAWTTLAELRSGHQNLVQRLECDLFSVRSIPRFALGQRALLLRHSGGNVLWDCVPLIDDLTIRMIRALGGIAAIAVSHPRLCSTVVEWSHAFGGLPIYLHAADRRWVARPDPLFEFWDGERLQLHDGITLARCGDCLDGGTVLHCPKPDGKGVLLTGDVVQIVNGYWSVSFLSSRPELVPRPARAVERIVAAIEPFTYDSLYDAWAEHGITHNASDIVRGSFKRYVSAIGSGDR